MHWTVDYLANEHLVRVTSDGNGPADRDQLRRLTRDTCDELARIPMHGSVESLNVSVASGICLFEARRQRG